MTKSSKSVLFFGKKNSWSIDFCLDFLRNNFDSIERYLGQRQSKVTDPEFPREADQQEWDLIISFLSPWIIPGWLLRRARLAAINFHPGPPEYPGVGCTNFAVYNGETGFGTTCHHMLEKVDTGAIVEVRRFPIFPDDTVYDLTQRCYFNLCASFVTVLTAVLAGEGLPRSSETWRRKPYTRRELDALATITKEMADDEIRRRVRATTFPGEPPPKLIVGDGAYSVLVEDAGGWTPSRPGYAGGQS